MPRSFPPDVIVLDQDGLLHARFARGKKLPSLVQTKSYRIPAGTFAPATVTPELINPTGIGEALRRLRADSGRWESLSLLLPDSWFRMNLLDLPPFHERQGDAMEIVRWSLKRTLPISPDQLRIAYEVLGRTATHVQVLVLSAIEKTLHGIEEAFAASDFEVAVIEPVGISLWNAIATRENGAGGDRLFVYIREDEFTTGVFRGSQPLFLRSRNLSGERTLQQEIRLSASYLRDSLRTDSFAQCYVAGMATEEAAAALRAEFDSPVRMVTAADFVDGETGTEFDAELAACTGVFAA